MAVLASLAVILSWVTLAETPPGAPPSGGPAVAAQGVVVLEIGKESVGPKEGLKAGDTVVRWSRGTAAAKAAEGAFGDGFDWDWFELEQVPRGAVTLFCAEGAIQKPIALPAGIWDITAGPALPPDLAELWARGSGAEDKAVAAQAAKGLQAAGEKALADGEGALGLWLLAESGRAWAGAGQAAEARAAFDAALAAAPATGHLRPLLLIRLGEAYIKLKDRRGGEDAYRRALTLLEGDPEAPLAQARAAFGLGAALKILGRLDEAGTFYERARTLQEREAPKSLALANTYTNLGTLTYEKGDLAGAREWFKRSLALKEALAPGTVTLAQALNNLGALCNETGRLEEAEAYFRKSLAIKEERQPDSMTLSATLNNLGSLAYLRRDIPLARSYYERSLDIRERRDPGSRRLATAYGAIGVMYYSVGDYTKAEEFFLKEQGILAKLAPGSEDEAMSLCNLAEMRIQQGRLEEAEALSTRAYEIRQKLGPDRLQTMLSLQAMVEIARARGRTAEMEPLLQKGLATVRKLAPDNEWEAWTLYELGKISREAGRGEQALGYFLQGIGVLEKQIGLLGGDEVTKSRFRAAFADLYTDTIELLFDMGRLPAAFDMLEKSRARGLLNMLATRELDLSLDLPEALRAERAQVDFSLARARMELEALGAEKDVDAARRLSNEVMALSARKEAVAAKIRQAAPRVADLQDPQTLDLAAAKERLAPGTLFLSYSVGPRRTLLLSLLDGQLDAAEIKVPGPALAVEVRAFYAKVCDPTTGREDWAGASRGLYAKLLQPVEAQLRRCQRVVVCPDGPLHFLPFGALGPDPEHLLIAQRPLSSAISLTVQAQTGGGAAGGTAPLTLAAFGAPQYPASGQEAGANRVVSSLLQRGSLQPLPFSEVEVKDLGKLFGKSARLYLGEAAKEEAAESMRPPPRFLHFACHGYFDQQSPLSSGLVLTVPKSDGAGGDGVLQAWEVIERVRLDTDLVTLSACQSGLGYVEGGEGMVGLSRAFLFAGSRAVCASLWSINDRGTSQLMRRFYTHLKRGAPCAEALRKAQLEMIAARDEGGVALSHPAHWAGFILIGGQE